MEFAVCQAQVDSGQVRIVLCVSNQVIECFCRVLWICRGGAALSGFRFFLTFIREFFPGAPVEKGVIFCTSPLNIGKNLDRYDVGSRCDSAFACGDSGGMRAMTEAVYRINRIFGISIVFVHTGRMEYRPILLVNIISTIAALPDHSVFKLRVIRVNAGVNNGNSRAFSGEAKLMSFADRS